VWSVGVALAIDGWDMLGYWFQQLIWESVKLGFEYDFLSCSIRDYSGGYREIHGFSVACGGSDV